MIAGIAMVVLNVAFELNAVPHSQAANPQLSWHVALMRFQS